VAASLGAPLVAVRARPGLRSVVVAFDVRRSDLPMRSAFPLLLVNALGYLADKEASETLSFATGRNARVAVAAGTQTMTVVDPAGSATTRAAFANSIDFPITRVGFYRLDFMDSRQAVPANLSDAVESDTEPVKNLTLGGRALAPPDPPRKGPRYPLWVIALVAAVALTLFEWWSYHRRWTV